MKKIILVFCVLVMMCVLSLSSYGQKHSTHSYHGGQLRTTGGYQIEMVKSIDSLNFYLTVPQGKVMGTITAPAVEFVFTDKQNTNATLTKDKRDLNRYTVTLPKAGAVDHVIVSFVIDGKPVVGGFKFDESGRSK